MTIEQLLFQLLLHVDEHVGGRTWNYLPIEDLELPWVELHHLNFSPEVVVEDLELGSEADFLVIKAVPAVVDANVGIIVTRLGFDALMHKHSV